MSGLPVRSRVVPESAALARRSTIGLLRQPQSWAPGLVFPLMLAAVYSSQFSKAVDIPGFPYQDVSFLDFVLPASILQGVLFGATNAASDLAVDIENGFMERLLSSPIERVSIMVGRLAGAAVYGAMQAAFLLAVFLVFGANVRGGVPSMVAIVAIGAMLATAIGSFGIAIAFRTGSQEVVQSVFPLLFVMVFVSSAFFPTELMEGWYGAVAERNPITWIIDPTRRLAVTEFSWSDVGQAIGLSALVAVAGITLAGRQLRRRVASA